MAISPLTRETKISKPAKGSFTNHLLIPMFDHQEFPHWMSCDPERPGLAGSLNCAWHWQQLMQHQIQTGARGFSTTALVAVPDLKAKESTPHSESRKRFEGMIPIF